MDFVSMADAVRFGLQYERSRVEQASYNLASANIAFSSLEEAQALAQSQQATFANMLGDFPNMAEQVEMQGIKTVSDPDSPLANAQGEVFYLDVDPVTQMATLVSGLRSYEANVRAYNTLSEINSAALSIGKR